MSNDSKKLLTLGNVEAIKDYIDTTSGNIKYYIDEEFKDTVNTKIEQAKGELNDNFIAKTTEITNKITLLEQTSGNKNEINELRLQLDAVKTDNDAMNTALESLSKELETGLNDVSGSIMSAGQINDLVSTALINSVNISDDAVEAPTVYTQNLVALIGKFGQIRATNIVGSEISGKTVKSTDGSWELNNNGAGKLANGNITWTENGDVTFGPNVKLNWSNIEGSDDATNGVEAAMDAAIAAAAAAATAQAAANEATALANEAKNSIPSEARITEITRNSITTENITGTTLSGKTIKSTDDRWELSSDGSGYLGNFDGVKAIEWDANGVKIQGEKVEISGDVKINGIAIITGIKNDENAKNDFDTMVAKSIDVDSITSEVINSIEIKTDVLETKPDVDTDKIHIEDNYIHCITNTGNKSLIISSDDIYTGELDTLFNPNITINDKLVTNVFFDSTTTYNGTVYACNSSIWRSGDSVTNKNLIVNYGYTENGDPINIATSGSKIGYIYKNGKINTNISLVLYEGNSASFNPHTSNGVQLKDWAIATQTPITNGWGIINNGLTVYPSISPIIPSNTIVGGDDTTPGITPLSDIIGRILVYRADTNDGIYYKYVEKEILGTTEWGESILGGIRTLAINDIEISNPGYYAVELCFNPNSFILLTSTTITNTNYCMHGGITTTIVQDAPADYMKIGKNGLVAFNSNTGFSIDDNNITMRARNNNNFYGLKISNNGIFIGDGNTTWRRLDTTKLFNLLGASDELLSLLESTE